MAQFNPGNLESPLSGESFINDYFEPMRDAIYSTHSGTTAPDYVVAGMVWLNINTNPWVINLFDGSQDIPLFNVDISANIATPAGLNVSTFIKTLLDDANASTARATLGMVIGADVQAYNSLLALLAGLTPSANKGIYFTGGSSAALFDLTSAGRALLDDADVAAQWVTLGLGTAAGLDYGTSANQLVRLTAAGKYPAVDGSLITNIQNSIVLIEEVDMSGINSHVTPLDGQAFKSAYIEFENMDCAGTQFMRIWRAGSEITSNTYYNSTNSVTGASGGNLQGAYNANSAQGEWNINGPAGDYVQGVLFIPSLNGRYTSIHGMLVDDNRVRWDYSGAVNNNSTANAVTDFQIGRGGSNNYASGSKYRVYGLKA